MSTAEALKNESRITTHSAAQLMIKAKAEVEPDDIIKAESKDKSETKTKGDQMVSRSHNKPPIVKKKNLKPMNAVR